MLNCQHVLSDWESVNVAKTPGVGLYAVRNYYKNCYRYSVDISLGSYLVVLWRSLIGDYQVDTCHLKSGVCN